MKGDLAVAKVLPGHHLHYLFPSFCAGPYLRLSLKHAGMCRDKDTPYIYQSCLGHLAHFLKMVAPICFPQATSYRRLSAPLGRQEAEIFSAQKIGPQVSIMWCDRVYGRFRTSMGANPISAHVWGLIQSEEKGSG